MALTESTMLDLGTVAPDFALPDVSRGQTVGLHDFRGQPLLVMFLCNHCPYVKHIADELARFAREYQERGLAIVGITSNDVNNYPDDSPDQTADEVKRRGYTFPYLYDQTQEVAHAYRAACTPDFFLFDKDHKLAYRGQFDDTRPNSGRPTGADLRRAADAVLVGRAPEGPQQPSAGCNIKWKPGNQPA